jgi:hypothetical protein
MKRFTVRFEAEFTVEAETAEEALRLSENFVHLDEDEQRQGVSRFDLPEDVDAELSVLGEEDLLDSEARTLPQTHLCQSIADESDFENARLRLEEAEKAYIEHGTGDHLGAIARAQEDLVNIMPHRWEILFSICRAVDIGSQAAEVTRVFGKAKTL